MEELKYLRDKVNQLEEMIFRVDDKIEVALSSFLTHRVDQVDGQKKLLQAEQEACLALLSQFKSNVLHDGTKKASVEKAIPASKLQKHPDKAPRFHSKVAESEEPQLRRHSTRIKTKPPKPDHQFYDDDDVGNDSFNEIDFDPLELDLDLHPISTPGPDTVSITQGKLARCQPDDEDLPSWTIVKTETTEQEYNVDQEMVTGGGQEYLNLEYSSGNSGGESDPDYSEQHESSHTTEPRSRRRTYTYKLSQTFDTEDEARAQIKNEANWSLTKTVHTQEGKHVSYRCKFNHRKCPVRMYVQEVRRRNQFELYRSVGLEHVHPNGEKPFGIPEDRKSFIDDVFKGGITKPELIIKEMRRRNIEEVPKRQLTNYIAALRRKRYGDLSFIKGPPVRKRPPRPPTGRRRGRPFKQTKTVETETPMLSLPLPLPSESTSSKSNMDKTQLTPENYFSSSSEDEFAEDNTQTQTTEKIARKRSLQWKLIHTLSTKSEVDSLISGKWVKRSTNDSITGTTDNYYCKTHGLRCSAKAKVFLRNGCDSFEFYEHGEGIHDTSNIPVSVSGHGLSAEMKATIRQLLNLGVVKPNRIIRAFEEKQEEPPQKQKLISFLEYVRKKEKASYYT